MRVKIIFSLKGGEEDENEYSLPVGAQPHLQQRDQQPQGGQHNEEGVPISDLSSWNSSEDSPEKPALGFFASGVKKSPGNLRKLVVHLLKQFLMKQCGQESGNAIH